VDLNEEKTKDIQHCSLIELYLGLCEREEPTPRPTTVRDSRRLDKACDPWQYPSRWLVQYTLCFI